MRINTLNISKYINLNRNKHKFSQLKEIKQTHIQSRKAMTILRIIRLKNTKRMKVISMTNILLMMIPFPLQLKPN